MAARSGNAKVAGLIGWPIRHSLSPMIHEYWLRQHAIDGAYVPFPVQTHDGQTPHLMQVVQGLIRAGVQGVNVTLPYKEEAAALANLRDPLVEVTSAANTLIFSPQGIEARNTDVHGFRANLEAHGVGVHEDASGHAALVLGAGGAARGVVAALLMMGYPRIILVNRTLQKAENVAKSVSPIASFRQRIEVAPWENLDALLAESALVVNTTSLGMQGQPPLELALDRLPATACVTDIVYKPLITPLLAQAQGRGLRIVDGLGMLLHQAAPGFAAWFGVTPQVDEELRCHVLSAL